MSLALVVAAASQAPAHAKRGVGVLFDAGHGQRFLPGRTGALQLSKLAAALGRRGVKLLVHRAALTPAALRNVAAVWIAGPFAPYRKAEVDALEAFVKKGGKVVLALHIGPPAARLLWRFQVSISNGVIREPATAINGRLKDFTVKATTKHALTRGIKSVSFYGAWALLGRGKGAVTLYATSTSAWVDLNRDGRRGPGDPRQRFSVAVLQRAGRGAVVVFGDDAIFQNRFLSGGNAKLVARLARWLGGR